MIRKTIVATTALVAAFISALLLLSAFGQAADANPNVVPLGEEPLPLSVDPTQAVFLHEVPPVSCTPVSVLAGSVATTECAERIQIWECPAGPPANNPNGAVRPLSAFARSHTIAGVSYNDAIAHGSHAHLDTHCERRADRVACPTGYVRDNVGVRFVVESCRKLEVVVTVDPPTQRPVPAFTG